MRTNNLSNLDTIAIWEAVYNVGTPEVLDKLTTRERRIIEAALQNMTHLPSKTEKPSEIHQEVKVLIAKLNNNTPLNEIESPLSKPTPAKFLKILEIFGFRPTVQKLISSREEIKHKKINLALNKVALKKTQDNLKTEENTLKTAKKNIERLNEKILSYTLNKKQFHKSKEMRDYFKELNQELKKAKKNFNIINNTINKLKNEEKKLTNFIDLESDKITHSSVKDFVLIDDHINQLKQEIAKQNKKLNSLQTSLKHAKENEKDLQEQKKTYNAKEYFIRPSSIGIFENLASTAKKIEDLTKKIGSITKKINTNKNLLDQLQSKKNKIDKEDARFNKKQESIRKANSYETYVSQEVQYKNRKRSDSSGYGDI